ELASKVGKFLYFGSSLSIGAVIMNSWVELFQRVLDGKFYEAEQKGEKYVIVRAGDLHRKVGGYPGSNHRMPICCHVLFTKPTKQHTV
ncbi:hypothetical protein KEJ32_04210, partial [Candidatus Bathyarchaeota archaeon]|nr:hypothetical protein [Candidatus Bathyarchaeota archaeon]